jgi:Helix-turn-helix domain of resolvase
MSDVAAFSVAIAERLSTGRPLKFTPERLDQIRTLVERGHSREEIASIIDVTVGSLAVTCSRLGISLRRVRLDTIGARRKREVKMSALAKSAPEGMSKPKTSTPGETKAPTVVLMLADGDRLISSLPIRPDLFTALALEAEICDLRLSELLVRLIEGIVKQNRSLGTCAQNEFHVMADPA